jgi:hypothetical protein
MQISGDPFLKFNEVADPINTHNGPIKFGPILHLVKFYFKCNRSSNISLLVSEIWCHDLNINDEVLSRLN